MVHAAHTQHTAYTRNEQQRYDRANKWMENAPETLRDLSLSLSSGTGIVYASLIRSIAIDQ